LVAGMGTSGTLMGCSRFFAERKPTVRVIGIEPTLGHRVQGLKNMQEAIVPDIYAAGRLHRKLVIADEIAYSAARMLALKEGIFAGMSSGAAVAGALQLAVEIDTGTIVVILPDRGDRYLSTNLFRSSCGDCPP